MASLPRPSRRWIAPPPVSRDDVSALSRELRLPDPVCELLVRRGFRASSSVRRFLRPAFDQLHPPGLLPDLEPAVDRILAAVDRGETILVHGDYDADGISAAALLSRGLRELGSEVEAFVPHRLRDGYDLGEAGLARAGDAGASLIVTADCGISAVDAVERAREMGVDVVVTDHHRPPERLPDAVALVNPARRESRYPFAGLSGTGVAFKLLSALYDRAGLPPVALNSHLDLVAIGTVADVVPLTDENRVLVRAGLRALERTRKPGLRALLRRAGVRGEVTARHVAFRLGPRLNAVGRVGEARTGLRLLLTEDPDEAGELADRLEARNRERREEDRRVQEEAERRLADDFDPDGDRAVVLWDEGWHPGVIGIVASRLVERVHRPTVLVSLTGDVGRGSGRSIPGFHLYRALSDCAELLERFGGHEGAAGLEIRSENLGEFRERLGSLAGEMLDGDDLEPELRLDLVLPLARADAEMHRWIEYLAPFGADNPRPVFMSRGVVFREAAVVGREGRHLRATLQAPEGGDLEAIGFGLGHRLEDVARGGSWDVAYELREDEYRGRRQIRAFLEDFRAAE